MKRIALAILMLVPFTLMAEIRYTILPLIEEEIPSTFGEFNISGAVGINNSGQVAISALYTVLRFSDGRGLEDIGNPSGFIQASGINDHGQVVAFGGVYGGGASVSSFRYSDKRGWEQLNSIDGRDFRAFGINNRGQVVGTIDWQRIFRYTDGRGIEELGPMQDRSIGIAINDHGWITGWSGRSAILYSDHLGFLSLALGRGVAINNQGTIAGFGIGGSFLYQKGGIRRFGIGGIIRGMNENDQVVGYIEFYTDEWEWETEIHGFFWSEAEGTRDLNDLIDPASGWVLLEATGINNSGQICGNGIYNDQYIPFRLDPIKNAGKKVVNLKRK